MLLVAAVNATLGLSMSETARRRGDPRIFLVGLAFLTAAGFLGLHALATPGVLLEKGNAGFTIATPVGLVNAAVLAVASSLDLSGSFGRAVIRGQNPLRIALAVLLVTWGVASLASLPPLDNPLTPEEQVRLAAADRVFEEKRQEVIPEADRIWKRITPTIEYIADHANLYAIRPLIIFDAARISDRNIPGQRTRLALGGGLQFNVVVAKFEVGYVRTVRRMPGDERGNFNIRMVFEKLF